MNLWLRLVGYLLTARGRPAIALPGEISVLRFRAWLWDLDLSLHMNNGRYLSLMDLGRLVPLSRDSSSLLAGRGRCADVTFRTRDREGR